MQSTQHRQRSPVRIAYDNGALIYSTPYDALLVAALKREVPAPDRQWSREQGAWLVAPQYAKVLVQLSEDYLDVLPALPEIPPDTRRRELRVLDVRYIGATKVRDSGERTAYGWSEGGWTVIFPESVLRAWFGLGGAEPTAGTTLYSVLGLYANADANEIRTMYRRLALQWHPDTSKEPNAKEQFIAIQRAYEVLRNPLQRDRYDAGLALEATLLRPKSAPADSYRSPLRCGLLLCTGIQTLSRFVVSDIQLWNDITDDQGRVLSTSWPLGADTFEEEWLIL